MTWTGAGRTGTSSHDSYARSHLLRAAGKPAIPGSSDPVFRGDPAAWNPEELLVASLSACHMLWFLHLAAEAGIVVTAYRDRPEGVMQEDRADGAGRFVSVTLRPEVRVRRGSAEAVARCHEEAHARCFIARSVNFPVQVDARLLA